MGSTALRAQLACIWEATARKAGNVHRLVDFEDSGYVDFLVSAAALAPVVGTASKRPVGDVVLEAVQATRAVTKTNTNLGIVLLLVPLAKVSEGDELRSGVARVLQELSVADARAVYQAIRLASPGGLGQVAEQDIRTEPTLSLNAVMALAGERDLIARQYANGFREVFEIGVAALEREQARAACLEELVIGCHLHLLAACPDTLIARKRGAAEAEEASRRAAHVLERGWPERERGRQALAELDRWLRAEGHGRNPGATADLVAASLFVALREDIIRLPVSIPWSCPRD